MQKMHSDDPTFNSLEKIAKYLKSSPYLINRPKRDEKELRKLISGTAGKTKQKLYNRYKDVDKIFRNDYRDVSKELGIDPNSADQAVYRCQGIGIWERTDNQQSLEVQLETHLFEDGNINLKALERTCDNHPLRDLSGFIKSYDEIVNSTISETDSIRTVNQRLQQHLFRKQVKKLYKVCILTGADQLVEASHIKSYSYCTGIEKVDINNGLLFIGSVHAAFDNLLLTFNEEGFLVISIRLSKVTKKALGISESKRIYIRERQIPYFYWHREQFNKREAEKNI